MSRAALSQEDLGWLRERSRSEDGPSLSALAKDLCRRKGWVNPLGKPKDVAARVLLNRLEARGVVELPARRRAVPARAGTGALGLEGLYAGSATALEDLGEVAIVPVFARNRTLSSQWNALMAAHHYLGAGPLCGAQMRYLVRCREGVLGGLAFSASARHLAARDEWIGWSEEARRRNLHLVVCNSRFLVVPRIKNLASHVLARSCARLPEDWENSYGIRPLLLETFVDKERFRGTSYEAAGWTCLGTTKGRGRQDRTRSASVGAKDIYVLTLDAEARAKLSVEPVEVEPVATGTPWEEAELGDAEFGDQRLTKRLVTMVGDIIARPSATLLEACGGNEAKAKGAYRFFSHEEVTMESILKPHYEASLKRCASEKIVLAVQDTTSLNYTSHVAVEGLGPIGNKSATSTRGLHLHSTLLVNTNGTSLGLLDAQCWARDPEDYAQAVERYSLPIEEKESRKWLVSYEATRKAQERLPTTRFVSVADREGDIYELFLEAMKHKGGPDLLIRVLHQKRRIEIDGAGEGEGERTAHLRDYVQGQPCQGILPIKVPRSGSRRARSTTLELRYAPVRLKPPGDKRRFKTPINLWAILAQEPTSPPGQEPIEWMLLTTVPVATVEECAERIHWYTLRWQIEVFHRTIKSGCRIQDRQLGTADSLKNGIAVDLVVGYRVFSLAKLARERGDEPCTIYFEEDQWKALVCFLKRVPRPPSPVPPTLREATRMVGKLGGHLGRKSDGEPGTQVLWRGLQRLDDITWAFVTAWSMIPFVDTG